MPKQVAVTGAFDNLRSGDLRFLQEASRLGDLHVLMWSDDAIQSLTGAPPVFPLAERLYMLKAVRYVAAVLPVHAPISASKLPAVDGFRPEVWVDTENSDNLERQASSQRLGLSYVVLRPGELQGFPQAPATQATPGRKRVVVTGCYDWFHSGHVRFFEEVSSYGELFVVVGHDANIRLLKGEGHPLVPQDERRYMVGSVRYVAQALVSSGEGWIDADPEIRRLKPDIYAVNEDGDRGGKREYCAQHGIQYLVLKRVPAPGLPQRSSTELRGF